MYLIFDEETETHHSHKRKSNPFDPRNYIVTRGWKKEGDTRCSDVYFKSKEEVTPLDIPDDVDVLVGHNIKFDLLYEMCVPGGWENLRAFFKRGGTIWCTQYAEYLLNAQREESQMCSMDDIIESYGGRKKIDGLKALWEAGWLTSAIDPDLLRDYLIGTEEEQRNSGDIGNTELIYKGQIKAAEELGMLQAIKVRMDGLCATTDMEYNGLKTDVERAMKDAQKMTDDLEAKLRELDQYISFIPDEVGFSWTSGPKVSCLLFGGTIRYEKQLPYLDEETGELARKWETRKEWLLTTGHTTTEDPDDPRYNPDNYERYKSGKKKGEYKTKNVRYKGEIKVKYQDQFFELPGITEPDPEWKGKLTDGKGGPIYSTSSEIIEELGTRDIPFLKLYAEVQKLSKILGTYYVRYDDTKRKYTGMLTCVQPWDHMVHHSLNHSITATTRLSSSNPNGQNMPRAPIPVKAMFVSRFGADGQMGEIDYSQLEVVVQGLLSGDPNLIRDLNAGIDFHCKRVAAKLTSSGSPMTYETALDWCKNEDHPDYKNGKRERTKCKEFSFQRAYGAGPPAIAASTGMPVEEVKLLIANEELEYPGVTRFNEAVEREVNETAEPFSDPQRGWRVFRRGTWQAPTGTMYSWRTWDAPKFLRERGITDSFSPPELKNYPVQGTGGEIVQMAIGVLWRWFVMTDNFGGKAFLVNTVHDCVWFDMHKDVVDEVISGAIRIMSAIPQLLKRFYDIDCPVPFPVEAEVGDNMLDLHHWTPKETQ